MNSKFFLLFFFVSFLSIDIKAENLSVLGTSPDWSKLKPYQESITQEEFTKVLHQVYTHPDSHRSIIEISSDYALIKRSEKLNTPYQLNFSKNNTSTAPARYWRSVQQLAPITSKTKPLSDLTIAIDPGHIGGAWSQIEERHIQIENSPIIKEGDITLMIAEVLEQRLSSLGASVTLVREKLEPITKKRAKHFRKNAISFLNKNGIPNPEEKYTNNLDPNRVATIQWQSEKLFYRTSEIRARAKLINEKIKPDLTLCLHLNAAHWPDPLNPSYVPDNNFHLLINGNYLPYEVQQDDTRLDLLLRLLQRTNTEEEALARIVAPAIVKSTRLPAYVYEKNNAKSVPGNPYLFYRNLLANRVYHCPVLFFEPYIMNNKEVIERLSKGDYLGKTLIGDKLQTSIYQDYINGVVNGLTEYYSKNRTLAPEKTD